MRLTRQEVDTIRSTTREVFGPVATVRLFGSRVDDSRRGGDIDLHVETGPGLGVTREIEFRFWDLLQERLGAQRIDIVVQSHGAPDRPIDQIAKGKGVALC
jgi:predicted nucleotidyltransferase